LNRPVTVTEKLDGTNSAVVIDGPGPLFPEYSSGDVVDSAKAVYVTVGDEAFLVGAQSRKRLITPEDDNHGFATWVFEHAQELANVLGPGRHFGEWWGSGIQRGYGLKNGDKRFSLFNTKRWDVLSEKSEERALGVLHDWTDVPGLRVVPTIAQFETFSSIDIRDAIEMLRKEGSFAVPGFNRPEGVVIYHHAGNHLYKVMLEGDEIAKSVSVGESGPEAVTFTSSGFTSEQVTTITRAMERRALYA
jgi:hypothetical protein